MLNSIKRNNYEPINKHKFLLASNIILLITGYIVPHRDGLPRSTHSQLLDIHLLIPIGTYIVYVRARLIQILNTTIMDAKINKRIILTLKM